MTKTTQTARQPTERQPASPTLRPTTGTAVSTPIVVSHGRGFGVPSIKGISSFALNIAQNILSALQRAGGALTAQISGFAPSAKPFYQTPKPPVQGVVGTAGIGQAITAQPAKVPPTAASHQAAAPSVQTPTVDQQFISAFQKAAQKHLASPATTLPTAASTPPSITPSITAPSASAKSSIGASMISPTMRASGQAMRMSAPITPPAVSQPFKGMSAFQTTGIRPMAGEAGLTSAIMPAENIVDDITDLSIQRMVEASEMISNVPQGATTYIFKDPIGGATPFFEYVIKPGENLTRISQKFKTSVEDILKLNKDRADAIKTPDLIIAGKNIRIPAIQKEIQPSILTQSGLGTIEDINKTAREHLKTEDFTFSIDDIAKLIEGRVEEPFRQIQNLQQQYLQIADPNFYVDQYNSLMNKLGIPQDLENLRNIQVIMRGTLEDALKEASIAGGLVTQSQIAEIVNFRHGILKQQASVLADIIEDKEKMLDNMMKYTLLGRRQIEEMLDRQLKIAEFEINFKRDASKWAYNVFQDLKDRNLKRLEFAAREGVLHTSSPEHLSKYINPSSMLYSGITENDLIMMIRISHQNALQEDIKARQIIEKIENAQRRLEQQMQSLKLRERGLELKEKGLEIKRREMQLKEGRLKPEGDKKQSGKRDWSVFKTK